MRYDLFGFLGVCSVWSFVGGMALRSAPASAQLVPDDTLENDRSRLTSQGDRTLIEGGATRNGNLFHSFQEFNINEGQQVYFSPPNGIDRILTRVTGSNRSTILGTLGVIGNADLFLLNPNGILFGDKARLDLRGSFLATTADRIQFDNYDFSATNPTAPPLLTITTPIGLQFGQTPGAIANRSVADGVGLQGAAGRTFGLLGGELILDSGRLTAVDGRIELGSVGASSIVQFDRSTSGYRLNYDRVDSFQSIRLDGAIVNLIENTQGNINVSGAAIEFSNGARLSLENRAGQASRTGQPRGRLLIQANTVNLVGGSQISTTSVGNGTSADIEMRANDRVTLSDPGSQVIARSTGNGSAGSVWVNAPLFRLDRGAIATVTSEGNGDTGSLTIQADQIQLLGGRLGLAANRGRAGSLMLLARDGFTFRDRPVLSTASSGGAGGNIVLEGENVVLDGGMQILARASRNGDAGNILVRAGRFVARENAQVIVGSEGRGRAGRLEVQADRIDVIENSLLSATTEAGQQGGILLRGRVQIRLGDRATISASTQNGRGGRIALRTPNVIQIEGNSRVLSQATGNGQAGEIAIATDRFLLRGGGQIQVNSQGQGAAGNLRINASQIEINQSQLIAETNAGAGGDIQLYSGAWLWLDQGTIVSASTRNGSGGRVQLRAFEMVMQNDSQVRSQANGNGRAGNIEVVAENLQVRNNAQMTVSNQGNGTAGNIFVDADVIQLNRGRISAEPGAGSGGNISITAPNAFTLVNQSTVSTNAQGRSTGGNIRVDTRFLLALQNSDITANAIAGQGGNLDIAARSLLQSSGSDLTATSAFGIDGTVNLFVASADPSDDVARLPETPVNNRDRISRSCPANPEATFTITHRGGLPSDPRQVLPGQTTLPDFRAHRNAPDSQPVNRSPAPVLQDVPVRSIASQSSLTEAQGWTLDPGGQVQLVAQIPRSNLAIGQPEVCQPSWSESEIRGQFSSQ